MSRVSEFRPEYGLVGAGAVATGLLGRLPERARLIGPVVGVSFRVASRIVNSLRAGEAVRSIAELDRARIILLSGSPAFLPELFAILSSPEWSLDGRTIICCDCDPEASLLASCATQGARVASIRRVPLGDRLIVEGDALAVPAATRLVTRLGMKPIQVPSASRSLFDAAITLGTTVTSGIADRVFRMLQDAGLRDKEALRLATLLISQTANDYERTGRQSWAWHVRAPDVERLEAQIDASGKEFGPLFRRLLVLALNDFEKHPHDAAKLNSPVRSGPVSD